ncbi:AAA family ATPase [Scytonema hofmannii PCC 7110]|uniref:AAA family ATPase n=1 Tax=Scytonema hofmannii PCC 7110 TaxID=128403 RepID=A0A139XF62_9CYAN|nr:MoxR family ATPase [Scytonema hofmannii]KYC43311.1 AAA family ATPase [Scytonema hofmannii PCC 7110]
MNSWKIFKGTPEKPHEGIKNLPAPPNWRNFSEKTRGTTYTVRSKEIDLVNAALYLRRPLLVTGKPGTGKTSLAYAVAQELQLGEVLRWNITTRSTLQEGLYRYDAIGRLQDSQRNSQDNEDNLAEIGKYIQLGALGTALLPSKTPRVLLIDEIDKSDIDLPNDLLNIFEEGKFEIPELTRIASKEPKITVQTDYKEEDKKTAILEKGKVQCQAFPFVILTSNGEREFPPAFLRRCLRLDLPEPTPEELKAIVEAHLGDNIIEQAGAIVEKFVERRNEGELATDQLLNAIYLLTKTSDNSDSPMLDLSNDKQTLMNQVLRYLSSTEGYD